MLDVQRFGWSRRFYGAFRRGTAEAGSSAGKDKTHLISAVLRKLSCHVLVTRADVVNRARETTGKNTVGHKATAAFALVQRPGTKLSAAGRFMEVGWVQYL